MRITPLVQAVFWMAAAWECVCAQTPLSVVVFNYAGVSHADISGAVSTAFWAYHAAGIATAWPVCDVSSKDTETCNQPIPADGRYLELDVMPRRAKTLDVRLTSGEPAGLALVGREFIRPRAYVFLAATKDAADFAVRPLDVVLGCVLVHESGHLLGLGHQPRGVMRAQIDAHDVDAAVSGHPFGLGEIQQLQRTVNGAKRMAAGGGTVLASRARIGK